MKATPIAKSSKKMKNGSHGLKLVVPKNMKFKELAVDGLLIPGKLEDTEALAPLDFTSVSSREVGRQHSYWAVRHSHLIFLVGNLRAEVGNVKHDLKNLEAQWMIKHVGDFKTKWEAEYAMSRNKKIKRMRFDLSRVEASLTRYEGLAEAYAGLRNAASREIARRSDERTSSGD